MVAPSVALITNEQNVTQLHANTWSNETPPSKVSEKTIGREAKNAFMVASNPAPILPNTISVFDSEVISKRIRVCLSFSWLTATVPARAAMNSSTIN